MHGGAGDKGREGPATGENGGERRGEKRRVLDSVPLFYDTGDGREGHIRNGTGRRRPSQFDGEPGRRGARSLRDSARSWDFEKIQRPSKKRGRVREAPGRPDVERVHQAILMRFLSLPRPLERIRSAQRTWLGPERIGAQGSAWVSHWG